MENRLQFHHVGTLVDSMVDAIRNYAALFGQDSISPVYAIGSQQVNVCFVRMGDDNFIELVESCGEDSVVSKMVKKRLTYYHIGYKVDNITSTVTELEQMDYRPMEYFHSEAFGGKRCIFLFSPDMHLIELIER